MGDLLQLICRIWIMPNPCLINMGPSPPSGCKSPRLKSPPPAAVHKVDDDDDDDDDDDEDDNDREEFPDQDDDEEDNRGGGYGSDGGGKWKRRYKGLLEYIIT